MTDETNIRPALHAWLKSSDYTQETFASELGVVPLQVRRWCKLFSDPTRAIPREPQIEQIYNLTGGAIGPADFYPPHLRPAPDVAEQAVAP